jgi:hypothetical protein
MIGCEHDKDQGSGFDWRPFLKMRLDRMRDNHGRGTALANSMAFKSLNYLGAGNRLEAVLIPEWALFKPPFSIH